MTVLCFDPHITPDIAWRIDGSKIKRVENLRDLAAASDYVSLHVPFIAGVTENLIKDDFFLHMKPSTHILNFARGGILDSKAYRKVLDAGATSKYVQSAAAVWPC